MLKRVFIGLLMLGMAVALAACGESVPTAQPTATTQPTAIVVPTTVPVSDSTPTTPSGDASPTQAAALPTPATNLGDGRMIIETTKGRIVLQLFTDPSAHVAGTILNFAQKTQAGYFNNLTFHRVEDWVIQGGDPQGTGMGGGNMTSEYNNIPFAAGSLGVARSTDPATNNDSQFFITKKDSPHLTGQYTNWGRVTEGMDVVSQIAVGDKITSITIEGVDLQPLAPEPEHVT